MNAKRFLTRSRIEAIVVLAAVAGYIWENYQLPGFYRINYVNKKYCEQAMMQPEEPSSLDEARSCFSPE